MKANIVWMVVCGIWSSTWLFIKIGLADIPPFSFAGIRFVLASVLLASLAFLRKAPFPRGKDWKLIFAVGILQFTLNYALVYWGGQYISSGLAAVLQSMFPAFGMLIAHFYLEQERLEYTKLLGVVVGIAGVAVIFSDQLMIGGKEALFGSIALVLSAFFGSYSNVLIKAYGRNMDPMMMASCSMAIGCVPLMGLGMVYEGNPFTISWSPLAIGSLLYLVVVGSVLAFALYYWLIRNMEVTRTMLMSLVIPVLATLIGIVVLDERMHWRLGLGSLLILTGLFTTIFHKKIKFLLTLDPR